VGDVTSGVRVDTSGNAVVVGTTQSADFPVTSNAFQRTNHQAADPNANSYPGNAFVTKFNASGTTLMYSSYFGGSGGEAGNALALDAAGNAYITGRTLSKDMPVSTDAFQSSSPAYAADDGGSGNAFVAKFAIGTGASAAATTTSVTASANPTDVMAAVTFTATVKQGTACGFPPTGSASFAIDGGAPIVVALGDSGQAVYTTSSLRAGTHTVAVSYSGNIDYAPSKGDLTETVIETPILSIAPTSLKFPPTASGSKSAPQIVTLKNSGGSPIAISRIALSGGQSDDYTLTNACGAALAAGASCTLSVTFKPVSAGTKLASVTITDNASGSPQSVALDGTGAAGGALPTVKLSATSLTFANQAAGTTSAPQVVTVTNSGGGTLTLKSITVTGGQADDFLLTETCGPSLAAGASCKLSITFKPVSAGHKLASITIADNASDSPQSVALAGTGVD
jgi:hypothetical protein